MLKQKIGICAISVALLVFVALLCFAVVTGEQENPFYIELNLGDGEERIELWQDGNGTDYVFLPSGADLGKTNIRLETSQKVFLNGEQLQDGQSLEKLELDRPYELRYSAWGRQQEKSFVLMQSANIPTMYIDTQSGSMEYIHEDKDNKESGSYRVYLADGTQENAGEISAVSGRGNYSWTERNKKPYSITLSADTDLLGLGAAKEWILLANATDATHMRNKLIYELADDLGLAYSPGSAWVELVLNGEYAGLYLLSERNEVQTNRVDIARSGGFLVSLELESRLVGRNTPYVKTDSGMILRIHYPENPTQDELTSIQNIWQTVENSLLLESGDGYLDLIDIDSWTKKYLIEEISGNLDGCFLSQYFYFDGSENDNKIYAGPVWDYDLALGNDAEWQLTDARSIFAGRLSVKEGIDSPWIKALLEKEEFLNCVKSYYKECRLLLDEIAAKKVEEYTQLLCRGAANDAVRWGREHTSQKEQSEILKQYLEDRTLFLEELWLEEQNFVYVCLDANNNANWAYRAVLRGEPLRELPILENTENQKFLGWYYKDTDEPFDPAVPITEDIELYAKWKKRTEAKIKSALKLAPLGVIAVLGVGLLALEVRRWKKSR